MGGRALNLAGAARVLRGMRRVVLVATLALLALPATASAQGIISSLSVNPSMVRDGAPAEGTVNLAFPELVPVTARLFSSDPDVASVPATTVIPAGSTSASFTISTNAAAPATIVQIRAAVSNVLRSQNLSVNAAAPAGPSLAAVSVTPTAVTGGSPATGRVTFSAPPDGAVVQLASSDPAVAQVPAETGVSKGSTTSDFPITTSPVTADTAVTLTARWFGVTRTTTLTVRPGAPAEADRVRITRARWRRGRLSIEATSTNPNAILSVHSRSGSFMFTLTNRGGGRFADERPWLDNPRQITVRSNLGGSATANVGG